ncbi:hypothetical protein Kpol_1072p10 [Vanderwaltozyma polyspora DSM 70294]|uniref:Uncharacterized protein n=1 Tax=Vanderwaltozyma polyspora (strain ATCC 22028 / DSM 70294 / BCRC 21397 / CBS 2163 / NBRC 10782 / NRRL Y-8283 / UCD 57-17) TaxID=436907 RepID=A7TKM8_VANPO|nr:uncharacterized protein Kpol_1072p10 [Vanderwaltozyma polyspora DSM 70294]EDO17140.1 hypothetical protein Kpol_1072p10 [Vanderwaltozyma polyspora DSM 70294]
MFDPESLPYYNPETERKVAVVTGGNSGIGWYTVLHLYMHGFTVYIFGRNSNKVNKAIDEIIKQAKKRFKHFKKEENDEKTKERYLGNIYYVHMDLTDLKSVERACKKFSKVETKLDVLVNNAAVMALPFEMTKDGFEIQLQTNYVSPFLLSLRLLPLIEAANGRLVTLSSLGHNLQQVHWSLDQNFNYKPNMIFTWFRYAMAKTSVIQFTKMMAIKYPNVLCLSIHPGLVMNTNLFSYWTRLPIVGMFFWMLFQLVGYFFGVSNEEGSLATIKCALSPELTLDKDNGKYFSTGGVETKPSHIANNLDNAASTWIWTIHELRDRGFDV